MGPTILSYAGKQPEVSQAAYLAPGCCIVGDVKIGRDSSIWFNAVVRGDVHWVRVGERTNVQDLCMLHVTHDTYPLTIGNDVTIGHSVTVHGCTIQDSCLIGMGAVVLDGAIVETETMIAAGAVVTPGFVVPHHTLVAGVPARVVRTLTDDEIRGFAESAARYVTYAFTMRESNPANP
ncbi:MAG TPA: gamma carbonic anhydrase family protein [Spirochaetia bacterium]|nr:gamma carbonic anhydrase family protein [Spirochaetia bacterium]